MMMTSCYGELGLAMERGRAGERYLLAGENRTYHAFFCDLCRAARRTIPRLRLPDAVATLIGYVNDQLRRRRVVRHGAHA